jgi:hypothetical protein
LSSRENSRAGRVEADKSTEFQNDMAGLTTREVIDLHFESGIEFREGLP